MKAITKHRILFFAFFFCCVFALCVSAEPQADAFSEEEQILFSYGTKKDEYYVTNKTPKTIYEALGEITSGDLYLTLYSDCTYGEGRYALNGRKFYLDTNGHTLTLNSDFLGISSGAHAYFYSSASGGVIKSNTTGVIVYENNSNTVFTIGADLSTSVDYSFGKNLTLYSANSITNGYGKTYIIGSTIIATGSTAPVNHANTTVYKADNATFFIEGCTSLEADITGEYTQTYEHCTFVNANTSASSVALTGNTSNIYTNCSFIGIIPTGNEGTFTVTDATIPTYGSVEASKIAEADGLISAKTSTAPTYSYKKTNGDTVYFTGNIKLLPSSDIVNITWKCGDNIILEEKWQKGSIPFIDHDISADLSFYHQSTEAVNSDITIEALAYPSNALLGSLSLYASIDFNLYFKQGYVANITVDGKVINPTEVVLNKGTPYMLYVYEGINPKTAVSKVFEISYTYTEDGKSYPCKAKASVSEYAREMLKSSEHERSHSLIASLLGYIKIANDYLCASSENISAVLGEYEKAGIEYKKDYTSPTEVPLPKKNNAVEGATIRLDTRPGFAFLLKDGYTGKLTVSIGTETSKVYDCKAGSSDVLVEGKNRWIVFDPPAYLLLTKRDSVFVGNSITVKEGENTLFTYSIDTYIAGVLNKDGVPAAKELYNYCRMAYEYFYEKKDLPYTTDAIVVNPNGSKGVVSFVVDDGNQATATYIADTLLAKYPDLKISYAMIANYLATLTTETDSNGTLQFKKDGNGNYVYTTKDSTVAFWEEQISRGFCDIINHSYSHSFVGYDDNGGEVTYQKPYQSDPAITETNTFPEGSITAEFLAAKQILNDIFGEFSKDVYVTPGVGVTQSLYYNEYLASLMGIGNEFLAARGTGGDTMNSDDILNNLTKLSAPMIGYLQDPLTWTGYMDKAVREESLICYCIHRIFDENTTNSQAITYSQADTLFGYAQDLSESGDLAIMLYYDALRYFIEKDVAEVIAENYNDEKIAVSLFFTDPTIAADSRMNYPLTVQVEVPANWVTVKYEQNGSICYANTKVVNEKTVVNINIVPYGGTATLTAELTSSNSVLESSFAKDAGDGVMLDKNYFPGFVRKSISFTIDDGNIANDTKFLNIVKPAGILGTFNLISTENAEPSAYLELYEGYEMANHNYLHCLPIIDGFENIPLGDKVYKSLNEIRSDTSADTTKAYPTPIEGFYFIDYKTYYNSAHTKSPDWHPIATDEAYKKYVNLTKADIETIFGEDTVVGYAYPHGKFSEEIKSYLKEQGYLYARKTGTRTTDFDMPSDRFAWTYNADNSNLLKVMKNYESCADDGKFKMFSFGVHSADFNSTTEGVSGWEALQSFADTYGGRPEDFWYATNRDIFEYEDAVNSLKYRNGKLVNNTDIILYLSVNGEKVIIPAYSSYRVADGEILPEY